MKRTIFRIIVILLTLLWMVVIFYFSNQSGNESSNLSTGISKSVLNLFYRDFPSFSLEKQSEMLDFTSRIIRKLAHFTEYAILGLLLFLSFNSFIKKKNFVFLATFIIGLLYSIGDEFHQSLVADRGPAVKDVVIDSLGVLAMLLIIGIIRNIQGIRKKV